MSDVLNHVQRLIDSLDAPDVDVRWHAADVLSAIGPAAAAAVPPLMVALEDPHREIRRAAERAIRRIGPITDTV